MVGGADSHYYVMTGGFEYTIPQVLGTDADLGIVGEVLLDDHGHRARTPFEDDVFVGTRFALDVEARSLVGVDEADLLYGFRRDGYLSVAVSRHF